MQFKFKDMRPSGEEAQFEMTSLENRTRWAVDCGRCRSPTSDNVMFGSNWILITNNRNEKYGADWTLSPLSCCLTVHCTQPLSLLLLRSGFDSLICLLFFFQDPLKVESGKLPASCSLATLFILVCLSLSVMTFLNTFPGFKPLCAGVPCSGSYMFCHNHWHTNKEGWLLVKTWRG